MFRKSWFLVCCLAILVVSFSPGFSAAGKTIIEKARPTLEKIGLPTDVSQIPGGTIQITWSDVLESGVYLFMVTGCLVSENVSDGYAGKLIELFVVDTAFRGGRLKRVFFLTNPVGEGWYIEYQVERAPSSWSGSVVTTYEQVPVHVSFVPKPTP